MYGVNLRPYGEYFAKAQAVTTTETVGNQTDNNPSRLDASQGGTAIVVATEKATGTLSVAASGTLTLSVYAGTSATDASPIKIGTAIYTNTSSTAAATFGADAKVLEYILPTDVLQARPYVTIKLQSSGSTAADVTGNVDVFPHYISHPRRG